MIHVIDLDGAFTGTPGNLDIVFKMVKALKIPVQLGGGLRTLEIIEEVLNKGVERVILGTMSLEKEFIEKAADKFKDSIIAGIDTKGGWVAIKGWKETSSMRPIVLAKSLMKLGVRRFLYTNVKQDGTLKGPNIDAIRTIVRSVKVPVIASGGISCIDDIRRLKKLETYGLEGVVVGKALYTGAISLKETISVAESKEEE
jgi:phosphoribosylformimino-5-aminoimidazole carboxamide ribotide isomerase